MTLVVSIGMAILPEALVGASVAAGTGVAGTTAATLGSAIGAGAVGGTLTGAGLGAITGAATGQGAGKGALMGAITGGIGGAAGPAVAGIGSTAGQIAGGALAGGVANAAGAAAAGKPVGTSAMIGAGLGGALAGINAPAAGAGKNIEQPIGGSIAKEANTLGDKLSGQLGMPSSTPSPGTPVGIASPQTGPLSSIGINASGSQILGNVGAIGAAGMAQNQADQAQAAQKEASTQNAQAELTNAMANSIAPQVGNVYQSSPYNPLGGLGHIGYAKGGHVALKDGAYIIPADVVSAIGNGSSKAGAAFLQRLMVEVRREAMKRQGMGAAGKYAT